MDNRFVARFFLKVDRNGPTPAHCPELGACWIWTAGKCSFGYGRFLVGSRRNGTRRTESAHRVSWEIHNSEPVGSGWVLHRCDIPACVNPKHLFLGTPKANSLDMVDKSRQARGSGSGMAKLSESDALAIRESREKSGAIASKYSISPSTVRRIRHKETWKHV